MTAPAEGPVALVSGGSRGLGQALVERLLDQGWRVSTFSRTITAFIEETLDKAGDRFCWQSADHEDMTTPRRVVAATVERFERLDLLVNNAGMLHQELLLTMSQPRIQSLITANLVAPIALTQAATRAMSGTGGGAVVNVSSINAVRGYRGVSVYAAAKAGIHGFSQSLARELGPFNIRVNSVVPGFFDTEMTAGVTEQNRDRILRRTPLGRLATIDEIVAATLFLASPAASFITGQTMIVDGGITC